MANGTQLRKDLLADVKDASCSLKKAIAHTSCQEVIPLRKSPKQVASVDKKAVLLYEDFDLVPDGQTEQIEPLGDRYIDCIADYYEEPGRYISNEYTPESGTWEGNLVMAGKGGTVILQAFNPMVGAYIATPLGDYSGNITVTVRARSSKVFWGHPDKGYTTTGGSALDLYACINGYDSSTKAKTDIRGKLTSDQLVASEGWQEITYTFHNEDAHADGYLKFHTRGAIEIDWIKVEDDNKFLANPVIRGATDFTNDGFTINWDPVRRAYNYYIDLWKAVYTSDKDINESCNFDDDSLPEWLNADISAIVDNEGINDSKAFRILDDDLTSGISTTDFGAKLNSFSAQVKFIKGKPDNDIMILCDAFGNDGWNYYGYLECDGEYVEADKYYTLTLDGDDFAGNFSAIRLYASGTNDNNYIYIDDICVSGDRSYELERVGGSPDDDEDDPYICFDNTNIGVTTSYTFSGLDPEGEYWYRVRSHHLKEFTSGDKYHALGVAAPKLLHASNTTGNAYTANWQDAPKAQIFKVNNYSVEVINKDNPEHTIASDGFSGCSGTLSINSLQDIGNTEETGLDEYTDLAGWRGLNNSIGQNIIGGKENSGSYLITPEIMANPKRGKILVYIEAEGISGDKLSIKCLKSGTSGELDFPEYGFLSGWLEIPAYEGEQIIFSSYNNQNYAINSFEVRQAVISGDIIRKYEGTVYVPAGNGYTTFSDLKDDGIYAFSVTSLYSYNDESTCSKSNDFMTVNLKTGLPLDTSSILTPNEDAVEIARYNINGIKVDSNYNGIVIIKMSDGSVIKRTITNLR